MILDKFETYILSAVGMILIAVMIIEWMAGRDDEKHERGY